MHGIFWLWRVLQLLSLSPLFRGENDIDQIYRVLQVLGTPSVAEVRAGQMSRLLPSFEALLWQHSVLQRPSWASDMR